MLHEKNEENDLKNDNNEKMIKMKGSMFWLVRTCENFLEVLWQSLRIELRTNDQIVSLNLFNNSLMSMKISMFIEGGAGRTI